MSEEENCERFNTFRCTKTLEKPSNSFQNSPVPISTDREEIFDGSALKSCSAINVDSLNKRESGNSVKGTKYGIEGKLFSQDNKSNSETFSTPTSNDSLHQLTSPIHFSNQVNIDKNLDKWVPKSATPKNLANERFLNLKRKINNSSQNIIKSDSGEASQESPLLQGLNRVAGNESMQECSTLKKVTMDMQVNTSKPSSSSRLTASTLIHNNQICVNDIGKKNSIEIEDEIESKLISQENRSSSETLSTPTSDTSSQQLTSPINCSRPVNIYKNLDKWVPKMSSPLNSANRRFLSLRRFINNSPKNIVSDSGEAYHDSPLLLSVKRGTVDECNSPKKLAIQSALCKENLNSAEINSVTKGSPLGTPVSSKRKVSDMLGYTNEILSQSDKCIKKYCTDKNNIKEHPKESTKFSLSDIDNKPSTSESQLQNDDNYQKKMKMTGNWIVSQCLVNNKKCNLFSDDPQIEKLPVKISHIEVSENSNIDDMEWTNAEPDENLTKITEHKGVENEKKLEESNSAVDDEVKNKETATPSDHKDPNKTMTICIVVDTNIFIHDLPKLKDILNIKTTGNTHLLLYIPWMVITELDYLKDSLPEKVKHSALNSMRFINNVLVTKKERVLAQSVFDMQHQKQLGTSADDKILACCLYVKEKYESVILLSNDLNLKNKVLIHNVEAYSSNEIIMKILGKLKSNLKYIKIHRKMSNLCSTIICDCAKETYGDIWEKMGLLSNPPWSLLECLKRFKNYWVAIFSDKLLKHCLKAVNEILIWLEVNKYIADDSQEYVEFVKYCITLCIYLRDIEDFNAAVQNTLSEITKIG